MEQEIESVGVKDNDPPRDESVPESSADIVDKTFQDEVRESGKALDGSDKEPSATSTTDDKHDEVVVSEPSNREDPEADKSREKLEDTAIDEIPEPEKSSKRDESPESDECPGIEKSPAADENPESSKTRDSEKSPEANISSTEEGKTLPSVACTDLDNLSLDEEKSQTSSIPDSSKDTVADPLEETIAEKSADCTAPNERNEEKASDEPIAESRSEKIIDKSPSENETAESPCIEEAPSDDPIVKLSSEKSREDNAQEDAAKDNSAESSCIEEIETPSRVVVDTEIHSESMNPPESETKKSADYSKSDSETTSIDAESSSKEARTEKQIVEPENTEFVQISQDKQDDAANEGQSIIDAEDPFGADNLMADSVEQTDVDSSSADDMNFHKLGDQAVNLQDVVNAKDQGSSEFAIGDGNPEDILEINAENPEPDPIETSAEIVASEAPTRRGDPANETSSLKLDSASAMRSAKSAENTEKFTSVKSSGEAMLVDSSNEGPDEDDDNDKKKTDDLTMETEDSQSEVLPGQDDELCIIPDSMKDTTSSRTDPPIRDVAEPTIDPIMEKSSASKDNEIEVEKEIAKTKEIIVVASVDETMPQNDQELGPISRDKESDKNDDKTASEKKSLSLATTTDVIDIDEEMKHSEIDEMSIVDETCKQCNERKTCSINVKIGNDSFNVCSQTCKLAFTDQNDKSMDIPSDAVNSKRERRCASCLLIVETGDERNLSWETMEFCNQECLGKFQTKYGSYCRNCNGSVQSISLGKYCVRFGYDVRQFCCSSCLEEFKKGLKVCSYCQKDISSGIEGFLAPVGDKGQFKDFCTQYCMEKYSRMNSNEPPSVERKSCSVCQEEKIVHCEVQIDRATPVAICSDPCFAAFKFVNKVDPEQCSTCKKFFELASKKSFVVFYDTEAHTFCSKTCLNIFIITNRKIVPCNWCKVKKYNFDMIKKDLKTGQALMMCSLNCLTLYQVSVNAVSAKRISCDFCKEFSQAQYHLTMSDATIRNFCSYNCVMKFQSQYTKSPITIPSSDDPVPTGMPKRTYPPAKGTIQSAQKTNEITNKKAMPVISSVTSLASLTSNGQVTPQASQPQSTINNASVAATVVTAQSQTPQVIVNQQVITRPPSPVKIHNKVTQCKPLTHTKGVSVRPHPCPKSTQTEGEARVLIPIPVPIYIPFPVHMWSMPFPVPVPFPLPIPVPIFIPTTRNSAKGIMKDIKRIQEKIPADPFEAELLMMAEMVATEKKANDSESDSSDDNGRDTAEPVDSSNTFGEDMLQMALKMATGELDEPAVDLETALTPNTITATQTSSQSDSAMNTDVQPERNVTASNRGKKRMVPYKPRGAPSKRGRRISGVHDVPMMPPPESQTSSQPRMMEPIEKPDANMALKYTFGVNAWRQWVIAKNAELEKQVTPPRKVKLFKTDLLQLTADELNYTLCLFVKEVRKPNGAEYAPDTIYYLCLGIQQYLFENNRIDNIFTDSYYEKFTDCLNDVAKKFSVLYNDAQYIVTRVEEEHLWECKQLGAHSPHVLLSTLMFFNTKHFNLVTVEEHMQLSFSHIMKHWKRNPAAQAAAVAAKGPGTRNVLLRFYPPQSALEANSRKKKVYEQQENEDNPLRCPVKLYEFYLSKCPESVKTRNDVFYLLPERSCVPDSPVWYSTSALAKEHLVKMLYRVKMVKEINVALLTS